VKSGVWRTAEDVTGKLEELRLVKRRDLDVMEYPLACECCKHAMRGRRRRSHRRVCCEDDDCRTRRFVFTRHGPDLVQSIQPGTEIDQHETRGRGWVIVRERPDDREPARALGVLDMRCSRCASRWAVRDVVDPSDVEPQEPAATRKLAKQACFTDTS